MVHASECIHFGCSHFAQKEFEYPSINISGNLHCSHISVLRHMTFRTYPQRLEYDAVYYTCNIRLRYAEDCRGYATHPYQSQSTWNFAKSKIVRIRLIFGIFYSSDIFLESMTVNPILHQKMDIIAPCARAMPRPTYSASVRPPILHNSGIL